MFARKVFLTIAEVAPALLAMRPVDVRYSLDDPKAYGKRVFLEGHVPGAAFADLDEELSAHPAAGSTARHPMQSPELFIQWCQRKGLGLPNQPVLCYDDMCGALGACRLWWMLDAMGVEAYVLNGGIQEYKLAGLPLEAGEERPPPAAAPSEWPFAKSFAKHMNLSELPPNAKIVDARMGLRFTTTVRPYGLDKVPGHIAGAVSHPFPANIEDKEGGRKILHNEEHLRQKMEATLKGKDAARHVFSCASGVTACHNIAVAAHLGYGKPFLYSGSWSEYAGVFKWDLQRQAIAQHGFVCEMKSKNLATEPRATKENCIVVLDGVETAWEALTGEQAAAVHSLHLGEAATVFFRDAAQTSVEIRRKP
jgi:thiosulfate/3-mercaptopyruvate sulfurtransferase